MTSITKTLIYSSFVLMIFFTSCTKDIIKGDAIMLLSVTTLYNEENFQVSNYEYDNKNWIENIVTSTTDSTGTFLSKTEYSYNYELKTSEISLYAGNKLAGKQVYTWADSSISVWTYNVNKNGNYIEVNKMTEHDINNDGKIVKTHFYIKNNNNEWIENSYEIYTWNNNNLIKKETYSVESMGPVLVSKYEYEYDDKLNPFYNDVLFYSQSLNNPIKITHTRLFAMNQGDTITTTTYNYDYDYRGYPTKRTAIFEGKEENSDKIINYFEYLE